MLSAILLLPVAYVVGYLAGWLRRDRRVEGDRLTWWTAGWNAAFDVGGTNPLKKRTTFATIEELTNGR